MKIISWNVNGIRAVQKKGFQPWFVTENPEILCIQETKSHPEQLDSFLKSPPGYFAYFSSAERKGYSGVALYSKIEPQEVLTGFGVERFDNEGRILIARYEDFSLFNIYFPNGKQNQERLQYKMDFYDTFLEFAERYFDQVQHLLIVTGDVNTAHREIDLARPKDNEKYSGFLPVERAWIDTLLASGYVDVFRHLYPDKVEYTWWDYKSRARERNIGWRIDYFFIRGEFLSRIQDIRHLTEVEGSDHCPCSLILHE